MKLYHRTDAADAILRDGFRDRTGSYLTEGDFIGVWLSDRPLDGNEGAWGDSVLVVDMPETTVVPFEWVEDGKSYREFLVPAEVLNAHPIGQETDA